MERLTNKTILKLGFSKVCFVEICITFDWEWEICLGDSKTRRKRNIGKIIWKYYPLSHGKKIEIFDTATKPPGISFIFEKVKF